MYLDSPYSDQGDDNLDFVLKVQEDVLNELAAAHVLKGKLKVCVEKKGPSDGENEVEVVPMHVWGRDVRVENEDNPNSSETAVENEDNPNSSETEVEDEDVEKRDKSTVKPVNRRVRQDSR